ncbi:hypothetical protein EG827_13140, partial [bacterium]|nr:hypothetical protein [bacterium]
MLNEIWEAIIMKISRVMLTAAIVMSVLSGLVPAHAATYCECDLNHDGRCNMSDWVLFGQRWGANNCATVPCTCDLNNDGRCNMSDWVIFGRNWGRTDCRSYSISGTIIMNNGCRLGGVTMTLTGTRTGTATTDASGNFSFQGLDNGSYTVTPSLAGYIFSPTSRTITISGENVSTVSFAAMRPYRRTTNFSYQAGTIMGYSIS